MTVVTTLELDDLLPLREAARQADGRHRRFGAGVAHPDLLDTGNGLANEPGHRHFQRVRNAEAGPVLGGLLHRLNNPRMRVTQDGRSPGANVIDPFVSIDIPDPRAPGSIDEKRLAA